MKTSLSRILDVEARCPELNDVTVNGIPIWSHLRKVWHSDWIAEDQGLPVRSKWKALKQLRSVSYGITNFLKPAKVICFTDATLRKPLGNTYVDKNFEGIVEHFGEENILLVERLSHDAVSHKPLSKCKSKRICSYSTLLAIAGLLPKSKLAIANKAKLEEVAKQESVRVSHAYIFRNFYAQYRAAKWFLKWKQPHTVFVNCYYGKSAIIRAAKELGIPVVETQHGLIRNEDSSYFSNVKLDQSLLPDTVLTFGTQEVDVLENKGAIVSSKQCIPFGSYMIDAMHASKKNEALVSFTTKYSRTVAVSGQEGGFEKEAVDLVNAAAKENPEIGFIYVPRMVDLEKDFYVFEKNVWLCKSYSVYDVIRHCDIHATVYSTCALEAGSLGKPTTFINCRGLSETYLKELMPKEVVLGYADSPEGFSKLCKSELKDADTYRELNAALFMPNQKRVIAESFKI